MNETLTCVNEAFIPLGDTYSMINPGKSSDKIGGNVITGLSTIDYIIMVNHHFEPQLETIFVSKEGSFDLLCFAA